jgi:hypothetical protein
MQTRARALARPLVVVLLALSVAGGLALAYVGAGATRSPTGHPQATGVHAWKPGDLREDETRIVPSGRSDASAVLALSRVG